MKLPIEGGCLCGGVRFRVGAPAVRAGYCHCRWCQLNSGAPVVAWAEVPAADFAIIKGMPRTYRSSAHGRRQFCGACGSFLLFVDTTGDTVSINTASLDDPLAFPPTHHIWESRRIAWFDTDDALPRHAEGPPLDPP